MPAGGPVRVRVHDFPSLSRGKAIILTARGAEQHSKRQRNRAIAYRLDFRRPFH